MATLESLISLFESLFPPEHVNLDYTPFETLPFELVICIADFLSPSASASFALSCRRIRLILGNQHLDSLRPKAFYKPPRLQKPLDIACRYCFLHHRCLEERHWNMLCGRERRSLSELTNEEASVCLFLSEHFDDITFRSIMKLHRRGIHCSKLLSLFTEVNTAYLHGLTFQLASACRVVNGRLLSHRQNWILYPARKMQYPPHSVSTRLIVCSHLTIFNKFLADKIACRLDHWNNVERNEERHRENELNHWCNVVPNEQHNVCCPSCEGVFQCNFCPTEFQIDTKDFGTAGVAIVMTRWLDLGDGRALFNPRWKSRLLEGKYPTRTRVVFPAGSIKKAFQQCLNADELLTPKFSASLFGYNPSSLGEGKEKLIMFFKRNVE